MRIVALDTYVTDFDGLEWQGFSGLGEFVKYDSSTVQEAKVRSKEAEAIIVNKVLVNQELLNSAPNLKYVGVTATGVNNLDLGLLREKSIRVCNVPGYSTNSVAEIVFSFIHDFYSRLSENSSSGLISSWVNGRYFSLLGHPTEELAGKTLGILGYGTIGKQVEKLAKAYHMNVLLGALPGRTYDDSRVELDKLLANSDILTLHCPLTEETKELVNSSFLEKMKPTAMLINTARGPIVNEKDLAKCLEKNKIAHAYLDVLCKEPPEKDNPLLQLDNITLTPHIAWATRESRERLIKESFLNLKAFSEGESRNIV